MIKEIMHVGENLYAQGQVCILIWHFKGNKAIIFREYFVDWHILPFLELLLGTENKPREL